MYRTENKYILPNSKLAELEARIASILPADAAGTTGYTVSSVYFDDIKDSMLRDTVDGNPFRDKYRIRIYNSSFATIKLEIKRKKYNKAFKLASVISKSELLHLVHGEALEVSTNIGQFDAKALFSLAIKNRLLHPVLVIAYERNAYIYESGNVRITFDRNIRASQDIEGWINNENVVWNYPQGTASVLEIKYDKFIPKFIMQALECNQLIQSANSKYKICREIYS